MQDLQAHEILQQTFSYDPNAFLVVLSQIRGVNRE